MALGDHIYVRRGLHYSHHGIDCGDGTVIHYVGPRGSERFIDRTPLDAFAEGARVHVRQYATRLTAEASVRNAESRLGDVGYDLRRNNCEHFAAWCCTGRATSKQVRNWMIAGQGTAAVVAAQSLGTDVALLGTVGTGIYALARPIRRR